MPDKILAFSLLLALHGATRERCLKWRPDAPKWGPEWCTEVAKSMKYNHFLDFKLCVQ